MRMAATIAIRNDVATPGTMAVLPILKRCAIKSTFGSVNVLISTARSGSREPFSSFAFGSMCDIGSLGHRRSRAGAMIGAAAALRKAPQRFDSLTVMLTTSQDSPRYRMPLRSAPISEILLMPGQLHRQTRRAVRSSSAEAFHQSFVRTIIRYRTRLVSDVRQAAPSDLALATARSRDDCRRRRNDLIEFR